MIYDKFRFKLDKKNIIEIRKKSIKEKSKVIFNIITPCSRPHNLIHIYNSIINQKIPLDQIIWWIIFDFEKHPFDAVAAFPKINVKSFCFLNHDSPGHAQRNFVLKKIQSGWVYFVDDDNIMHPDFLNTILSVTGYSGVIVSQIGKDNNRRCTASPKNTKVCHIDTAQFILKREIIDIDWKIRRCADGIFIQDIYQRNRGKFLFIDKSLCYYNYLG